MSQSSSSAQKSIMAAESSSSKKKIKVTSFDWRNVVGKLPDVKHQGFGESCFACVVLGVMESLNEKKILLSCQDVFKLTEKEKDKEKGASIGATLAWIRENGCILEEDCPYDFNGDVTPFEYERKPCLRVQTFFEMKIPLKPSKRFEENLEWEIQQGPLAAEMLWVNGIETLTGSFEVNIIGCMTDCKFYIPDSTGDNTGLAFRTSYHFAKSSKNNKEVCACVGSTLCSVVPGFKNSVEKALNAIGVRPCFVSLPSQAHENNIVASEISQLE
ncbi:hypothetical protein TSUD_159460 [Trifolium subterraneum]|uniref:Peptidase C1A papain C-terminal domain-containing protein n=1 Tax=Trifolium subterraneum TaxID=3900 RepID=A0A2Z6M852_TRISU|nr:hypothetical protein TSUD_159460 [Trifolium subterraneum]